MKLVRWCFKKANWLTFFVADILILVIGPLFGTLALCLLCFVTSVYFSDLLPIIYKADGRVWAFCTTFFGIWLLINAVFNHLACMLTSPGGLPEAYSVEVLAQLTNDPELYGKRSHRYCSSCEKIKPMRAHHCAICKQCVLKMDHHCPWVNNCVGNFNHRYFVLFLIYLCAVSVFFLFVCPSATWSALVNNEGSGFLVFATVLAIAASIASGIFLFWNLYLVGSNQTTIEVFDSFFGRNVQRKNPFHVGFARNVALVFGGGAWWTVFFPLRVPPQGEGHVFAFSPSHVTRRAFLPV